MTVGAVRDERRSEEFCLDGAAGSVGAGAQRPDEQGGGHPFRGPRVVGGPSIVSACIQATGSALLGTGGVDDVHSGDLAKVRLCLVVGDETRVEQRFAQQVGLQGQVAAVDQLRRPLALICAAGLLMDCRGEDP